MKEIKEYMIISNDDWGTFKMELDKSIEYYQSKGYELDIKYSTCVSNHNGLVQSVMILCY